MTKVLLIPLEMMLQFLQCLFLVGMSGGGCDDGWWVGVDASLQLLLKVRLKVRRLVARLGWSLLLRFLHKMLWFGLVSYVSRIQLNANGSSWERVLVLVLW